LYVGSGSDFEDVMAVTVMNSAIFRDMTQCNLIELPTFRGNVVPPSSRVNSPENENVSV